MNWIFSLQKSIAKSIFAGYTGSKNPVRNRLKIQFVELDFSKLIFQKSSTDQQGEGVVIVYPADKSKVSQGYSIVKDTTLWYLLREENFPPCLHLLDSARLTIFGKNSILLADKFSLYYFFFVFLSNFLALLALNS